jgi:hypothetical protein
VVFAIVYSVLIFACITHAAKSAPMPRHWHAPRAWLRQAVCAHRQEGAWDDNTGNGYFGGFQFARSTWTAVGGADFDSFDHPGDSRYPFAASIREQLYRAYLVWDRDAGRPHDGVGSWREWGYRTRVNCGLR